MYAPASSPHDPNLMFVSCDMGGFYRSDNGGRTWNMLDFRMIRGSTQCRPVFHPRNPDIIYFDGKVSTDAGLTWTRLVLADVGKISVMGIDPDEGRILLVGSDKGTWISWDGGGFWQRCAGVLGSVVGMYVEWNQKDLPGRIFVGTNLGIFRSTDRGKTFAEVGSGLPWLQIRSFCGGREQTEGADDRGQARNEAGGKGAMTRDAAGRMGGGASRRTGRNAANDGSGTILYCTIPSRSVKGRFGGGIYRSQDGGTSWQSAMGEGLNTQILAGERGGSRLAQYSQLGVAATQGRTVYVVCKGTGPQPPHQDTIYRSDDAGATWRSAYYPDPRDPRCNVQHGWLGLTFGWTWGGLASPDGFAVNAARPQVAMVANSGELFITTDGGKVWRQAFTRYAPDQPPPEYHRRVGRWESIGLEVTTTWNYDVDPFDHRRHYICYTDIGFAISEDGGRTWHNNSRSSGTPWTNTTYMLAFDPLREGKAWAAMSNVHDIPHWTHIHDKVKGPGGVCVSTDHCATWAASSDGLPEAPCTSIALDPTSPPDARTLYVTVYGQGLYKSADGGKTWKERSEGLPADNKHVFLVKRHADGSLYVCVTGLREGLRFPVLGGLYRSRNGADSWENVTRSLPLHWPVGFDFDPADSDVIYLAAATIPGAREGGLYKTVDGGKTWSRLLRDEDFVGHGGPDYVQAMFVTVDPRHPDDVYLGTAAQGLWYTRDAGRTWRPCEDIPFGSIQRVAFDPEERGRIYVTTFGGGVWRGTRAPSGSE
jgi:photosystem II stability/assembly factor-like uncharacterized protein